MHFSRKPHGRRGHAWARRWCGLDLSACFIILGGFQLLTSRMLDSRRIFAVGIALIFGLSVEIVPDLYHTFPAFLKPIFSSSTSVATVPVVMLSLLFRIGLKKHCSLELQTGHDHLDEITQFMDIQGSGWGMRSEIVVRATDAAHEVVNNLGLLPLTSETITLRTTWDELRLDLDLEYAGPAIELADSMPALDELGTQVGAAHLAGYMIRQYADRVRIREKTCAGFSCILIIERSRLAACCSGRYRRRGSTDTLDKSQFDCQPSSGAQ